MTIPSPTGTIPPSRRGRILQGPAITSDPDTASEDRRINLGWLLWLCLPMFGQTFHYMIDVPPLYYLSKAWPILSLPLAVYAATRMKMPMALLYGALTAYLFGVTPILSMIYLGNGLVDAAATTAKSLPFLYYFSACGFLLLTRMPAGRIRSAYLALGALTFIMMALLWMVMPDSAYRGGPDDSKLFLYDYERGNRIYMPMFFGMTALFYLARRVIWRRDLMAAILVAVGFALLLHIYKQRTAITAAAGVMALMAITSLRGVARAMLLLIGTVLILVGGYLALTVFWPPLQSLLGGSLSIRENSTRLAMIFMTDHPLAMAFGAGSITRLSASTMQTLLHSNAFYLADLGWLGVAFEYGIAGTLLILCTYILTVIQIKRLAAGNDLFAQALGDQALYLLLTTVVYSPVFTPGELATAFATAVTLARLSPPPPSLGHRPAGPTFAAPASPHMRQARGRTLLSSGVDLAKRSRVWNSGAR